MTREETTEAMEEMLEGPLLLPGFEFRKEVRRTDILRVEGNRICRRNQ